MHRFWLIINFFKNNFNIWLSLILCLGLNDTVFADPLAPNRPMKDPRYKNILSDQPVKDPIIFRKTFLYDLGFVLSNSRIDGFQLSNNSKGILTSGINIGADLNYNYYVTDKFIFSAKFNFEMTQIKDDFSAFPIDNGQNLNLGLGSTNYMQLFDSTRLKLEFGLNDRMFYYANTSLTGYKIDKAFLPYLGVGFILLLSEYKKYQFGLEPTAYLINGGSVGRYNVDAGQAYQIDFFATEHKSSNALKIKLFYYSRVQKSDYIRIQEQKLGLTGYYDTNSF